MSDYELQLKVKNGLMLTLMREAGYQTAAELARATNIQPCFIGRMLNLKETLFREGKHGTFHIKKRVKRVADTLGCSPQDLFPQAHWFDPLERNHFTAQVNQTAMEMLSHHSTGDPQAFLEHLEQHTINRVLAPAELNSREEKVLRLRFEDELTLDKIGEHFTPKISHERVRQLLAKALRKLRRHGPALQALNSGENHYAH